MPTPPISSQRIPDSSAPGTSDFFTDRMDYSAPALVSPANGANTGDLTPEFVWSAPPEVQPFTIYTLQVANDAAFSSLVLTAHTKQVSLIVPDNMIIGASTLYWRVRAGNKGTWSASRTLVYTQALVLAAIAAGGVHLNGQDTVAGVGTDLLADNRLYTAALGSEIIDNATIDSDVAGWTPVNGPPTWAWDAGGGNGRGHLITNASNQRVETINETLEAGATYEIVLLGDVISAAGLRPQTSGTNPMLGVGGVFPFVDDTVPTGAFNLTKHRVNQAGVTTRIFRWGNPTAAASESYLSTFSVKKSGTGDAGVIGATLEVAGEGSKKAYSLDGTDDYLLRWSHTSYEGFGNCWIAWHGQMTSVASAQTLYQKTGKFLITVLAGGQIEFTANYGGAANAYAKSVGVITAGQPFTLVVGINNAIPFIYLNGVEVAYASQIAGDGSPASNTNDTYIGRLAAGGQNYGGLLQNLVLAGNAVTPAIAAAFHATRVA